MDESVMSQQVLKAKQVSGRSQINVDAQPDQLLLKNIATQTIDRIGGIDDDAAALQTVNNGFDLPRLRIIWMYVQKHD